MTGSIPVVLNAIAAVFGLLGLGAAMRRLGWLTSHTDDALLKVIVRVLLPSTILANVVGNEKMHSAENLLWPPLVAFATVVGGFAMGWLAGRVVGRAGGVSTPTQVRTFAVCTGLYNYGYLPIPLVATLYKDSPALPGTMGVLLVFLVGVELALWTVGVTLMSGAVGMKALKSILSPPAIAVVVAVLLNVSGGDAYVPPALRRAYEILAPAMIPMSLLVTGAVVADVWKTSRLREGLPVIAFGSLLRLAVLPAAFVLVAWAAPLSMDLKRVLIVQAAMPCAVFPVVLSRIYGGDVPTAVRLVIGTSLISLLTTPLWLAGGMAVIGDTIGRPAVPAAAAAAPQPSTKSAAF
jgi:predicted permease